MYTSLWLLLLLFCASCATAPPVQHPKTGVATPEAWTTLQSESTQTDTSWWATFNDARLNLLVTQALDHNFNLQAAAARLQAAQAQARIAGAPLYPQAGGKLVAARRKQNFLSLPIPNPGGGVNATTKNSFGVSLDLAWEIDLWGRIGAEKSAALADFQAAQADLAGARLSLAAQTAKVWFAAVESRRQVELAQATVDNFKTSSDLVRARYERGLRPSLDLRLSLSSLAGAEAVLQQRRIILDRTTRQLELLLGQYPAAELEIAHTLPDVPPQVPSGLPADLISRRPDLAAAERRLAASHARLKMARRELYPRISLTASGGTSTQELKDLLDGDFGVWTLMGNLVQPLFQGGRIRAGIDMAKAGSDVALAGYAQSALTAYAEVESALASEEFLTLRLEALEIATEQSLAARHLAEDRYAAGLTDLVSLLEAQRSAYESESQLLAARRQHLDHRIDLHLALGGGFDTPHTSLSYTKPSPP